MYCRLSFANLVMIGLIFPVLPEILICWLSNYFVQTSWRVHRTTCTLHSLTSDIFVIIISRIWTFSCVTFSKLWKPYFARIESLLQWTWKSTLYVCTDGLQTLRQAGYRITILLWWSSLRMSWIQWTPLTEYVRASLKLRLFMILVFVCNFPSQSTYFFFHIDHFVVRCSQYSLRQRWKLWFHEIFKWLFIEQNPVQFGSCCYVL